MIKVSDPKQNQHCWCGILTDDSASQGKEPNKSYAFLKTSRDAHFVSQGTAVEVRVIKDIAAAIDEILNNLGEQGFDKIKLKDEIMSDIKLCQSSSETDNDVLVEITAIDKRVTTPLTKEHNLRTEFLFRDDFWLDRFPEIDPDKIKAGRELPCLPRK